MKNNINIKDDDWDWMTEEYFFHKLLRGATEDSYIKVLRGFRKFIGPNVKPEDIDHKDILRWRRLVLNEKKLSPHTWNNKVTHMRALYNFALKTKRISPRDNPFNKVSARSPKKRKKTLEKSQMTRVYLVMQQFEEKESDAVGRDLNCALFPLWFWRTVVDTLRYTGMRQNQLLHVRLKDINLTNSSIDLRLEGSKNYREWSVPVVSQLWPRLAYLISKAEDCGAGPSDHIFNVNRFLCLDKERAFLPVNTPLQPIRSFFRRLSKECGFAVSPHRFRHTLATVLMMAPDRNLQLVKSMLGHRSLATTMEYIDINMDVAGKTLERELALYTDSIR
ncbi:tyrosine-type recombinase/integrase [Rouxiella silvae]|uniref:tyrosine-type recombinase/integrase n=1 Tax=Rouxiella silvae TaxID=1646373 RepID=UPI0039EE4445